jgi:cytochrome c biogenesis protein CcmG, thiol:disulfide interchange protein DsbE
MSAKNNIKFIVPFIILFALLGLLWRELFYSRPNELPSALIGETVPEFRLPNLFPEQKVFTQKDLIGRASLLNIWATWCYACRIEQPMLMKIKEQYHVPIYSIAYKDNPQEAITWLRKMGNPYVITGNDNHGNVSIDFGVYGTPETFVISPGGKIIYRHIGAIDQKAWDEVLYPLLKKYQNGR